MEKVLKQFDSQRNPTILYRFIFMFVILLAATVSIIGTFIFSNWESTIRGRASGLSQDINLDIVNQMDSFFQIPVTINSNYKIIENVIFDIYDEDVRNKFFVSVLSSNDKYVYSFSYGTEKGQYYGARWNEKGSLEVMKNDSETGGESWYYSVNDDFTAGSLAVNAGKFDPRTRLWYKAAVEAGTPVFSAVYKHFVMPDMAISVATPVYDGKGKLLGVLGTHMLLSCIDKYLSDIVNDKNGCAVIIEKETGYLIANSLGAKNFTISEVDGSIVRNTIRDIGHDAIQKACDEYIAAHDTEPETVIEDNNDKLYFNFHEYSRSGMDWLIISAVPESFFTGEMNKNIRIMVLLTGIAALLLFTIFSFAARILLKPINELLSVMESFHMGNLSSRSNNRRKDEVGRISQGFNIVADKMQTLINRLASKTEELYTVNESLEEKKEQLRLILDTTAEAVYGTDTEGICTFCNKSCLEFLGYTNEKELLGKCIDELLHHSTCEADGSLSLPVEGPVHKAIQYGQEIYACREIFQKADNTFIYVEYHAVPQYKNGEITGAVVTFTDITERVKDEARIRFLNSYDTLTGLLNRLGYDSKAAIIDTEGNLPISVVFINLDGLRMMNDTFGKAFGDEIIIKAADILRKICRDSDVISRIGGDEFLVLMPRTKALVAKEIAEALKSEYSRELINGISCSMSVGIETKTDPIQKIESLIETAEYRMHKEKTEKRLGVDTIISMVKALHEKSLWDKGHSEEVSRLSERTGIALGMSEEELIRLKDAAYLHDIGKVSLSENILEKDPEMLTETQNEMMEQHPAIGYRILNLCEDTRDLAEAIYSHHEKWDGSGYPEGLSNEEIPLLSRIISIAETYERILSTEDYSAAGKERALRTIAEGAGTRFDPKIARLFIKLMTDGIIEK